ncbi:long-chain fatty acid--CoA ligase [Pseudonocardia eucalypti]|uniref:Long-chain fatty acid--CoA ligase n=1 Tax=Pseudonocardia eucalypti TaxID=648755 RepID=A0ABP9PGW8_9PSEU|nr:long-chain acyl-CoA synthetase [Pseudonocardia eucalypti]
MEPGWGREVVVDDSGAYPVRVYRDRRRLVPELLRDCRRWADRECLVQGQLRLTFAQHENAVLRVAGELAARGVRRGDPVLLYARNSVEWVVAYWAVLRLGAVAVLGNGWWSAAEVAGAIGAITPKLVITDERLAGWLPASVPAVDTAALTTLVTSRQDPPEPPAQAGAETDPAVVIFTSGTTGAPKGAVLPHRAVIANLHNLMYLSRRLPPELPDDYQGNISLHTLPLFHVGGIQALGMSFLTGAKMIFVEGRFDAGQVLELIERERVTSWACVPTMLARVVEHPDVSKRDTSSVRSLTAGGSSVPTELAGRAARAFPNMTKGMASVYGLTEAGGTVTFASGKDMLANPGTVGRPVPVAELRFEPTGDPEYDALGGEILVRSPQVMLGYWGQPESDAGVRPDGWLCTGDLGKQGEDGWVYLVGRKKDIIIRGGENVASAHVEARLRAHPAVAEVAVVGLAHPDLGEEVAAAVVLRPGELADPEELRAFAAEELAGFAVPSRWWVRDEPLPTNAVGKVVKRELVGEWPTRSCN